MKKDAKDFLLGLQAEIRDIISKFEKDIDKLDVTLMLKKPNEKSWSVIECIEHINISNKIYMDRIKDVLKTDKAKESSLPDRYKSSFVGNYLANAMAPKNGEIKNKVKTFEMLEPTLSDNDTAPILFEFRNHHNELIELIEKAKDVNINKLKISTFVKFVKINIGDAFRVMNGHTRRHILQAENVLDFFNEEK